MDIGRLMRTSRVRAENIIRACCKKVIAPILVALMASGCATVKLPLAADGTYPEDWPDISSAGPLCGNLGGTYGNEGSAVDRDGSRRPVFLSGLLERNDTAWEKLWEKTESVTLKVVTEKLDANGDSFARLEVTLNGEESDPAFKEYAADFTVREGLARCYCVRDTMVIGGRRIWWEGFPYVAMEQGMQTLYMTKAADGSLVVRVEKDSAGLIVIIPHGKRSFGWARFEKVQESSFRGFPVGQ